MNRAKRKAYVSLPRSMGCRAKRKANNRKRLSPELKNRCRSQKYARYAEYLS